MIYADPVSPKRISPILSLTDSTKSTIYTVPTICLLLYTGAPDIMITSPFRRFTIGSPTKRLPCFVA